MPQEPSATCNATSIANGLKDNQSWRWSDIDCRKDYFKVKPQAVQIKRENACMVTRLQQFLLFLGQPIINLVIKCANKNLPPENLMDRGGFLCFLGLQMLISAISSSFDKMEHQSITIPIPETSVPFRFNKQMLRNQFKSVQNALCCADKDKLSCTDKHFSIRKLLTLLNASIEEMFRPGQLNCPDELMPMWNRKTSYLEWVFCPHEPHPFGNKYYAISCTESGVMCGVELAEGKD